MTKAEQITQPHRLLTFRTLRVDEAFGYLVFIAMIASVAVSPFRYLNYLLPILALLIILANRAVHVDGLARPYVVIAVAALILAPFATGEGAKDVYLILTGLSATLVGLRTHWSWQTVMTSVSIGLGVFFLLVGTYSGWNTVLAHFTLDFAGSRSTLESGLSYIFGLLAVWAAYNRRWRHFAIALLFAVLTLKRIVIIGILLCLIVQFLPRPIFERLLKPVPMILANALFLFLILSYGSGTFDALIHEYTSQSANQFGMGRQVMYSFILQDLYAQPWRFTLMGMGPGEAYDVLKGGLSWVRKENLHGDTLKILYEYGALVLALFIWALYSSRNRGVLLIALYTNILLLTDNTLIYPFYIYFATLVAASIVANENTRVSLA